MKWLISRKKTASGFRFDLADLLLILALGVFAYWLHGERWLDGLWFIPVYVGITFFLFCNVFRIGNRLEPAWYVPFTASAAWCIWNVDLALLWQLVLFVFEPLKWLLITFRIWRGPYRGIFAESLARISHQAARNV